MVIYVYLQENLERKLHFWIHLGQLYCTVYDGSMMPLTGFSTGSLKITVLESSVFAAADYPEHCPLVGALLQHLTGTYPLYTVRCLW